EQDGLAEPDAVLDRGGQLVDREILAEGDAVQVAPQHPDQVDAVVRQVRDLHVVAPPSVWTQTLCWRDAACPWVLPSQDGDRAFVDRAGTAVVLLRGSADDRVSDGSGAGGRAASANAAAGR